MKIKSTVTLPEILAITGKKDFGPSEGQGSTCCPHCGASGRYVWYFICVDGSRRGAMSGCLQLFPQAKINSRYARLIQEAFNRQDRAKEEKKSLASWWQQMVDAAERFGNDEASLGDHNSMQVALVKLHDDIREAEGRRQDWLRKSGYGRRR